MPKVRVCAVMDSAVAAYGRPIFVPTIAVAVRSFSDEVNRSAPDNGMFHHSEDFVLWHLSDFDDELGEFLPVEKRALARGKDVKQNDAS